MSANLPIVPSLSLNNACVFIVLSFPPIIVLTYISPTCHISQIPYYGYTHQDRKMQARVPISTANVARLLESMGMDRGIAVDLHCGQIQGFFSPRVPFNNLNGGIVGINHFGGQDPHHPVIVSLTPGASTAPRRARRPRLQVQLGGQYIAMLVNQHAHAGSVD